MSDPIADARRAADAARAGIRTYEDRVLEEADRDGKLAALGNRATAARMTDLEARFPAMRGRTGR